MNLRHGRLRWRGRWLGRDTRVARLFFLFLLLGQNGLQHIAGLGDMRQIDLGNDRWRSVTATRCGGMR